MRQIQICARLLTAALLAGALLTCLYPGIRHSAGGRNTSETKQLKKTEGSIKGLKTLHVKKSTVYYTDKDDEYAGAARTIINIYLPLLCEDFGLSEQPPFNLVIYPDKETMYAAIGYNAGENSQPYASAEPIGAYSNGILAVLPPSEWSGADSGIGSYISEGPLIHELCHFLLNKKTKGNYSRWFAEGTALYYESVYLGRAAEESTSEAPASYMELSESFRYINEKESYRKSFEIINTIVENGGEKALRKIYDELEDGKSLNRIIKRIFGDSYDSLDKL